MTTLTCPCGRRLNVRGMPPGKEGRCPGCGASVRVPDRAATAPAVVVEDEWNWEGTYDVATAPQAEAAATAPRPDFGWGAAYDLGESPPAPAAAGPSAAPTGASFDGSDGPPPPVATKSARPAPAEREPAAPEPWFPPALLFPARGMEGTVMVGSIGVAFWVMGTLVPEYCLALMADAERIGTPTMGHLVTLVTSIPVLLLAPAVVTYWLQYLARVLVSGAEGERNPPRPPDRDLDGLLTGMGSWLAWGVLGLGGGLVPVAAAYRLGLRDPAWLATLGLLGWPYALMALPLSFLHDEDLAARPWRVAGTFFRVGPSFLALALVEAGVFALGGAALYLDLRLREGYFWAYVPLALPCWWLLAALMAAAMHTLGAYFHPRRKQLRWRRPKAWWNNP